MKRIIYILLSSVILSLSAGCDRQVPEISGKRTVTISVRPKLALDVDVRSVEIGKSDVWCFMFDGTTNQEVEGSPFKQIEIDGDTYKYRLPQLSEAYVHFAVMPENMVWKEFYSTENTSYIDCNVSYVTTDDCHLYMNGERWDNNGCDGIWLDTSNETTGIDDVILQQRHRKAHVMFRFLNLPEGKNFNDIIKKIHVNAGGIELDTVLTPDNMDREISSASEYDETQYEWYAKDIYLYFGYDYRATDNDINNMNIIIETIDGKILKTEDMYYSYQLDERLKINIDYHYISSK